MSALSQTVADTVAASCSAAKASTINTVGDLIDAYMRQYSGRDVSRTQRLEWWRTAIGALPLRDLDDDPIFHALEGLETRQSRFYAGLDADGAPIYRAKHRPISPATINRYSASLAAVFTWSIKKRQVPKGFENPCHRLERKPESSGRVRFLSDDERARLLSACKASTWPRLYLLVLMAITTGARRGELDALCWPDIDLDKATAYVNRTKNGDCKVLPLLPAVVLELKRFQASAGLVFGSKRRPAQAYNSQMVFATALQAARIKDFRFHDLRHSCASYLAQSGATLLEIADVLGHRQLSVTRRYSHLTINHKTNLLQRVLGAIQ